MACESRQAEREIVIQMKYRNFLEKDWKRRNFRSVIAISESLQSLDILQFSEVMIFLNGEDVLAYQTTTYSARNPNRSPTR